MTSPRKPPTPWPTPPSPVLTTLLLLTLALGPTLLSPAQAWGFEFNAVLWDIEFTPVEIELHDAGVNDLTPEDLEQVVQNVIDAWNSVPCSWIKLTYIGRTPDHVEVDGRQILEFIKDEERWFYGTMSAGAMIADVFDNPETPEREQPRVDIAFNGVNFDWVVGGSGDIRDISTLDPQAVLTHEMGHLLGLSHSPNSNAATMAAAYVPDLGQSSLSFDDKSGLCEKYWTPGDECQDDSECPPEQTCQTYTRPPESGGESANLCAEHHGLHGDFCSGDDLNCVHFCLFTTNDFSEGACTNVCEPDDEATCPSGWICRNIRTDLNPFWVCREDPDAPTNNGTTPDAGEPDTDVPDADTGALNNGTTNNGGGGGTTSSPPTDTGQTGPDTGDNGGGGDCGCVLTGPRPPLGAGGGPLLLLLSLAGGALLRRRTAPPP